jgi:hypothetical protein
MPASYMDFSGSGDDEEEHFANYARAFDQIELVGPIARTVVQSAKPEQSQVDYFGLPALRLSYKKRAQISEQHLRQMVESTAPSQLSLVDSTPLFGVTYIRVAVTGTPDRSAPSADEG